MNRLNVLVRGLLEPHHLEKVRAVSEDVEILTLDSIGEVLEAMPDVDVVFGAFTRDMFERG